MFYEKNSMCFFVPGRIDGDYAYDAEGNEYQIFEGTIFNISYIQKGGQSWLITKEAPQP